MAALLDPERGTLPDGYVTGTGPDDWPAFFDLVRTRGWDAEPGHYEEVHHVRPVPGMELNFFRRDGEGITFDVDLREVRDQERLDVLCAVLADLGRAFGNDVRLVPEGGSDWELLRYDAGADRIVVPSVDVPSWAEFGDFLRAELPRADGLLVRLGPRQWQGLLDRVTEAGWAVDREDLDGVVRYELRAKPHLGLECYPGESDVLVAPILPEVTEESFAEFCVLLRAIGRAAGCDIEFVPEGGEAPMLRYRGWDESITAELV
ncbi:hypothetical protein [Labedaea rhizosphaerae]|uniref:Uncharacterized protein n=1 Tax=Labedaea rhizosphaerae TaxID=598644 RepID=A0A4R6S895_LABRH|nr:hypothetical protein [Labedaea rhizosphaerae]TDP96050.1 hypothetical protein EV186_10430 [Labedaea rhizosphaerae]